MSAEPVFTVTITCTVELTVDEVWPDNDGPKDPTAEDVAEAMQQYKDGRSLGKRKTLEDWALLDEDFMEVYVEGPGLEGGFTSVEVWKR